MKSKEKRKWIKKIKPYWKSWKTIRDEWLKNQSSLEDRMSKELGEKLEFFYCDGEIAGIGHQDYLRRDSKKKNYFPLIRPKELGGY